MAIRFASRTALSLTVWLVGGCTAFADADSPAWQAGYADGCAAAQALVRMPASDVAERQQPGYRAGFANGRALCRRPDPSGMLPAR